MMSRPNFNRRIKKKNNEKPGPNDFDLEKARREVFNLGIKGFSFKDKRQAKRELAIRLGAKPKKPRGKNIKQHLEELRERKHQEQEKKEDVEEMGSFRPFKNKKQQKKKGLNEVRGMDYQLGRFKNGVQLLSKEDIERIKKK